MYVRKNRAWDDTIINDVAFVYDRLRYKKLYAMALEALY